MSLVTFGARLSTFMEKAGLNQTQIAGKVAIERTILSRVMIDKLPPQSHEIGWLAEALGVTVDDLLDGVELPEPARRDVERAQELARKVLDAEQACDAAVAELEALKAAHAAELAVQARVLETVRAECCRALDAANTRILETEPRWRAHCDAIAGERNHRAAQVAHLETQLAGSTALFCQQKGKIDALEVHTTQVKECAGQAALVVGLLGLAGGAASGASGR